MLNDIMNPANLLELEEDQFKVQLLTKPNSSILSIQNITDDKGRKGYKISYGPNITYVHKDSTNEIDCDGLCCGDCKVRSCKNHPINNIPM